MVFSLWLVRVVMRSTCFLCEVGQCFVMHWLMLKSKAGWGQNAKAFVIHLAHQHIVHSYEVNSQWLLNNQIKRSVKWSKIWTSDIFLNVVTEDKSCTIACGWTGFVCFFHLYSVQDTSCMLLSVWQTWWVLSFWTEVYLPYTP